MSSALETGTSPDHGHRLRGDYYGSVSDQRDGVAHRKAQRNPAFDDGYQLLSALFDRRTCGPDALQLWYLSKDRQRVFY